jgi:hypothetical protein
MTYSLYGDDFTGSVVRTDLDAAVYYRSYVPDSVYQVFPVRVDTKYFREDTVTITQYDAYLFKDDQVIFWRLYNGLPDTLYQNKILYGVVIMDLPLIHGAETDDFWYVASLDETCNVPAGIFDSCALLTHTEVYKAGGSVHYKWYFSLGTGLVYSVTDSYIYPDHWHSHFELESITNPN